MNIAIVSDNIIPAFRYGGTERVIWGLGKELSARGHRVTFVVRRGSWCDFARVVEIDPAKELHGQIPAEADIVHFNSARACEGFARPHVVTIHGNNTPAAMDVNSIFVSRDHAARHGSQSFVHNGLDWDDYGPARLDAPRNYFHFLGKAAWKVKNLKDAMAITRAVPGGRLRVLGGSRLNFKMGFRFTLSPRIRFYGMIGGEEKFRLLEGSKGLVFPVRWDEPFGLAVIESLYFGAPVFGTPYGSLPELVGPEAGFLSASRSELARQMLDAGSYSARRCHEYARDTFNSKAMTDQYLRCYETVLNGNPLNDTAPGSSGPGFRMYELTE